MNTVINEFKKSTSNSTEVTVYKLILTFCAVVSLSCVCFFMWLGAKKLMTIDIVSCLFFLVLIKFTKKSTLKAIGTVAYVQISVHSVLLTLVFGWRFGFALYLICLVPLAFYIPFKRINTSLLMGVFTVAVFTMLRYYTATDDFVAYRKDNIGTGRIAFIYIINSVVSFMIVLVISLIYNLSRKRSQQELERKNDMLRDLAFTDPLTRLSNRNSMYLALRENFRRAENDGTAFTVILSDIDDFKTINDTYGHNSGDMVLKRVAEIFRENVPEGADVCRWGGEEILVLLPDCQVEQGAELADELRRIIAGEVFKCGEKKFFTTLTFGVCENKGQYSVDKMISKADKNLYSGKRSGKNCVIC